MEGKAAYLVLAWLYLIGTDFLQGTTSSTLFREDYPLIEVLQFVSLMFIAIAVGDSVSKSAKRNIWSYEALFTFDWMNGFVLFQRIFKRPLFRHAVIYSTLWIGIEICLFVTIWLIGWSSDIPPGLRAYLGMTTAAVIASFLMVAVSITMTVIDYGES